MTTTSHAGSTSHNPPRLSVIVPTEGRQEAIGALVFSLVDALATYRMGWQEHGKQVPNIELLVVDSTVPPVQPADIPAWDPHWMRVVRGSRNVRQKRNQGVREAHGEWIAFVDSDCWVTPGYLTAVMTAVDEGKSRAFAGRIEFRGPDNPVWRLVETTRLTSPAGQTEGEGEVAWCATANLIVERRLFQALGGFDESLPFRLGGDDVDLGLRLKKSGNPLRILPQALVVHPKEPWSRWADIVARTWRWGRVEYHLGLRHPDRVRPVPPFFLGAGLTLSLACVVGVVLTGRLALLWLVPLWILTSTLLSTFLIGSKRHVAFVRRYCGEYLQRLYHLGTAWEHLRSGSISFMWKALILEERLELLFPAEPLRSWSKLAALVLAGLVGAGIVAR